MSSIERTRRLFLRLLGVVYLIAFASLEVQIEGLLGVDGLRPAAELLQDAAAGRETAPVLRVPTVFWWTGADDAVLRGTCRLGVVAAALLATGLLPLPLLALLWILYLSLVSVGGPFLRFQWDALLLETGFLSIFWAPLSWRIGAPGAAPSRVVLWLLRWLLFRLMFFSGWVKLASGDPTWWDLSALSYHFWTQPLPAWTSWYANLLPGELLRLTCGVVLVLELALPFAIFAGRRARLVAACGFALLQLGIAATGSYGFFNLLSLVLCVPLLDDGWLGATGAAKNAIAASSRREVHSRRLRLARDIAVAALLLGLSAPLTWRQLTGLPSALDHLLARGTDFLAPFEVVNPYGLFAVMTKTRPEVVVEGSEDGTSWRPYELPWKPGALDRAPGFAAPHMPRLDWQLWFDGLAIEHLLTGGRGRSDIVTPSLLAALRRGSPAVRDLLAEDPFPAAPPRFLRWRLYRYRFTSGAERAATGDWWQREPVYASEPVSERPAPD